MLCSECEYLFSLIIRHYSAHGTNFPYNSHEHCSGWSWQNTARLEDHDAQNRPTCHLNTPVPAYNGCRAYMQWWKSRYCVFDMWSGNSRALWQVVLWGCPSRWLKWILWNISIVRYTAACLLLQTGKRLFVRLKNNGAIFPLKEASSA